MKQLYYPEKRHVISQCDAMLLFFMFQDWSEYGKEGANSCFRNGMAQ